MADEQEQQHETVTIITTERNQHKLLQCRFLILLVESCSKLVISVTECLVEVVD